LKSIEKHPFYASNHIFITDWVVCSQEISLWSKKSFYTKESALFIYRFMCT
jgi:hypothetical protein